MSRTIIFVGLLLLASPAIAQSEDHLSPRLDMGELIVRPGIAEFKLKLGQLWACLSRSRTDAAEVVARTGFSDSGQLIRIQFASGRWMELAFRPTGHASLLLSAKGSDIPVARTPDELSALVRMLLAECRSQR